MSEKTYEMLWDCRYCQQRKNLGKTHRFCPNCGGEQDATARYFPSDDEKVAVEDHQYVGADVVCPACRTASSRAAHACGSCGSPLTGGASVTTRADQVVGPGQAYQGQSLEQARAAEAAPPAPAPKAGMSTAAKVGAGCGCATVLGVILLALLMIFWKKDTSLVVAGHTWERAVVVERYGPQRETAWCDQVPPGGREISRARAERSTEKIKVGETCKTRKVDNGDGTFKEKKECTPKYEEKLVLDDRCVYEVTKWATARTEKATGAALGDGPRWPAVTLARSGQCEGCEREGARTETYTVQLVAPGGGAHTCDVPEARWRTFKLGAKYAGQTSTIGDVLDCSSLVAK